MADEIKKKEWADWGEACGEWVEENPDKDLLTELCKAVSADSGGDHPPLPPPKP